MQSYLARLAARITVLVDAREAVATMASEEDEPTGGRLSALRQVLEILARNHPVGQSDKWPENGEDAVEGLLPEARDADIRDAAADMVAEVSAVFDLTDDERQFLVLVAAPHIDDTFGVAYDLLCGGSHQTGLPTVGVALELCDLSTGTAESFAMLEPSGSLRRHRLIGLIGDGTRLRRYVTISDAVLGRLLGSPPTPPMVTGLLADTVPIVDGNTAALTRALLAGLPLIWCHGSDGTAGVGTATGAFDAAGLDSMAVDLRRAPRTSPLLDVVAAAAQTAALTGRGLVVCGLEDAPRPQDHLDGSLRPDLAPLVQLMEQAAVPVIVVSSLRWQAVWTRRTPLLVDLKALGGEEREQMWGRLTGDPELARSVRQLRLTPEGMLAAVRYARTLAMSRAKPGVSADLIHEATSTMSSVGGVDALQNRARQALTFQDLVVAPDAEADLRRLVRWGLARDRMTHAGQVHGKAGKASGLISLFAGGPGTGKTMAAHVVADELGLELMQVNLSAVVDKYIGETEKNLERIFAQAEMRNVVLFFDEADALFGSRSEVKESKDRYANQEVSYLLQRIERYDGIAVLASNLRGNLDQAFTRRLHLIIHFTDPDEAGRHELWRRHLAEAGPMDALDPIDVPMLSAVVEVAGGDIKNIVLAACYEAFGLQESIGMRHVLQATLREFGKLGRRPPPQITGR